MRRRAQGITFEYVLNYLYSLLPESDQLPLTQEDEVADRETDITPLVGRFVTILAKVKNPKRVLEIGSSRGYSTVCLGRPVSENDGRMISYAENEDDAQSVIRAVKKAGLDRWIDVRIINSNRDALHFNRKFDMIFLNQFDQRDDEFFDTIIELLDEGGILLISHRLLGGSVAIGDRSSRSVATRRANYTLVNNPKLESVILPVEDGVSVSVKVRANPNLV